MQQTDHGFNGFPICRHCGEKFTKWNGLTRHIARHGCPALERGTPEAYAKTQAAAAVLPPVQRPLVITAVREGSWEALLDHTDLCTELKQRCALCYQWIASGNGIRKHLRTKHPEALLPHESAIGTQAALWKPYITSPCQACGTTIADRRQHAGNCLVLLQLMLMSCVLAGHCKSRQLPAGPGTAGEAAMGTSSSLAGRGSSGTGACSSGLEHGGRGAGQGKPGTRRQPKDQGKRRRTSDKPVPGSDQGQGTGKGKSKGKGKGKKDASKMELNEAVQLMAAVTLQLADQASRVQLDTSFLLTMKNEQGPENLLPIMYNVWKAWKTMEAKEPEKLDKPLRCSMMISMLMEIKARAQKLQADPEQQERLKTLEWTDSEGRWVYRKWSPERETLYLDQARKPVPQATFIEQLDKAMELIIRPENMPRFQSSRGLTPEMKGYAVSFNVDIGLRAEAEPLYRIFTAWVDLQAWALGAVRIRPHRLKRSPAVDRLSTWLGSR